MVLSRNEIVWYFCHRAFDPPRAARSAKKDEDYIDDKITDLIYITNALIELIIEHKDGSISFLKIFPKFLIEL